MLLHQGGVNIVLAFKCVNGSHHGAESDHVAEHPARAGNMVEMVTRFPAYMPVFVIIIPFNEDFTNMATRNGNRQNRRRNKRQPNRSLRETYTPVMRCPWMRFYNQVAIRDSITATVSTTNSYTVLDLLPDLGGEPFATRYFKIVSFELLFAPLVTLTVPLSVQMLLPMPQATGGINGNVTAQYIPCSDLVTLSPTTAVRMVVRVPRTVSDFIWGLDATTQTLMQLIYVNPFTTLISPYITCKTTISLSPDYSAGTV